ncbi:MULTISPECIES: LacI family DNA-binding transcriptional regulator [unclassified Paenibacillus]|uniref:LacI family DNA-binding transcriptional regulator n=1 Tax=unclassified Paenibacillus TaxID=185978 RepID=UPI0009712609|nr:MULTISPECIES: LacI family DNA-binding transcriptional regulator [unclassified Paenibacillus]ASS66042.1 LacI family transcriptional regulator [Paenibacillus sp. RUD330]
MTTIKDLAKYAGVSVTTVSRALNGYDDVNEGTRQKIQKAAKELNYRPNVLARSLVTKKTRTLGVILSDINRAGAKDAMAFEILCGINDRAGELDYEIMLFSTNAKKQMSKSYSDLCKERNVDGAIISGLRVQDPYLQEVTYDSNFPCVLIDIPAEGSCLGHVTTDNVEGASMAVRHLIEQGHRHIAMINGHNDAAVSLERLSGYRKTLEKHGIAYRPELVFNGSFSEEGGCEAMFEILLHHPEVTGVFSASDLMVLGALRAVERSGGKVPERISIVGYDDIAIASYSSPKLTTIRQNKYEMGYQAAQLLVDLIEGRPVNHKIMLHNELIIRESTSPCEKP